MADITTTTTAAELKAQADAMLDAAGLTTTGKPKRQPKAPKTADKALKTPKVKQTAPKATKPTGKPVKAAKTKVKAEPEPRTFGGFKLASTVLKKAKGFAFDNTASGQLRTTDGRYTLTALIKWAAGQGYTRKQVIAIVELLMGVTPDSSTVGCHSTAGRFIAENPGVKAPHHHGPVAELTADDKAKVRAKIGKPGADNDE